ncbi:hypothetical protein V1514DRAFT_326613 [Lipomyces japonicus]|uniref:uncharacterized protein n=1 Tax=Lipomyces japonicus TaxID=56871 RepID=UPI0034CE3658
MTVEDHVIVIQPSVFEDAAFDVLRDLPSVKSVTFIRASGYGGHSLPLREITAEEWAKTTILVTGTTLPPSRAAAPNLRLVQLYSAGSNAVVKLPFFNEDNGVVYATASGTHGPAISEWVILNILNFFHHSSFYAKWQAEKRWGHDSEFPSPVRSQYGRTIGILGYGALGRQTARVAQALGMRVIAHSFSNPPKKERVEVAVPGSGDPDGSIPAKWYSGQDQLDDFFTSGLDVLVISVPLTPETKGLINARTLGLLKGAFVVNIARGAVVDTDALIEALESEHIAGAALDVTDPEPLTPGHKLWTTKNVVISPHISGHARGYEYGVANIAVHNVKALDGGWPLANKIDKTKGY